jgi:hypothetical protein
MHEARQVAEQHDGPSLPIQDEAFWQTLQHSHLVAFLRRECCCCPSSGPCSQAPPWWLVITASPEQEATEIDQEEAKSGKRKSRKKEKIGMYRITHAPEHSTTACSARLLWPLDGHRH